MSKRAAAWQGANPCSTRTGSLLARPVPADMDKRKGLFTSRKTGARADSSGNRARRVRALVVRRTNIVMTLPLTGDAGKCIACSSIGAIPQHFRFRQLKGRHERRQGNQGETRCASGGRVPVPAAPSVTVAASPQPPAKPAFSPAPAALPGGAACPGGISRSRGAAARAGPARGRIRRGQGFSANYWGGALAFVRPSRSGRWRPATVTEMALEISGLTRGNMTAAGDHVAALCQARSLTDAARDSVWLCPP